MNQKELDIILNELKQMRLEIMKMRINRVSQWMDVRAVAEYLGYSTSQIYKLVENRMIPFCKKCGKLRFNKNKIDRWLSSGEVRATSEKIKEIMSR